MTPKQIAAFAVGPILGSILSFITLPIISWYFSSEDIGRFSMFQMTCNFSILLFSLGLDQAYIREYHETEDKSSLLKATFTPGLILTFLILSFLYFIPTSFSKLLFDIDSSQLTAILVVVIILQFTSRYFGLILRMQNKGLSFSMSQVLYKLVFLIIVVTYTQLNIKASFKNLITAYLISFVMVFVLYAYNTRKSWTSSVKAQVNREHQKYMISYGLPLVLSSLMFWGLTVLDKVLIRSLSSFEELGIYSVAISFASIAVILQSIFSTVWAPIIYKWHATETDYEVIGNVINSLTLAIIILWCIGGMFAWVSSHILPAQYEQVQFILVAMMAYPLLYTLSEATGIGINIKKKTAYSFIAVVIALIFNSVGNWYLIPIWGSKGAAITSSLSFLIFFIIKTEISSRIWINFKRTRMYLAICLLTLLSIIINITNLSSVIIFFSYLFVLIFLSLTFKKEYLLIYSFLEKRR